MLSRSFSVATASRSIEDCDEGNYRDGARWRGGRDGIAVDRGLRPPVGGLQPLDGHVATASRSIEDCDVFLGLRVAFLPSGRDGIATASRSIEDCDRSTSPNSRAVESCRDGIAVDRGLRRAGLQLDFWHVERRDGIAVDRGLRPDELPPDGKEGATSRRHRSRSEDCDTPTDAVDVDVSARSERKLSRRPSQSI